MRESATSETVQLHLEVMDGRQLGGVTRSFLDRCCQQGWFEQRIGSVKDIYYAGVADADAGRAVVTARVRLRSGQMVDMTVSGPVSTLTDQLGELAIILTPGGSEDHLRRMEARMRDVLRKYRGSAAIHRDAALMRLPSISLDMARKMIVAATNRTLALHGLPPLDDLPPSVMDQLRERISTIDLVRAYVDSFDSNAVCALERFCSQREINHIPLNAYNGLLHEGSGRNRAQALLVLPSLFQCVTTMRVRQGGMWSWEVDENSGRQDVLRAIDSSAPLFKSLATVFGVKPETIRWLRTFRPPDGWRADSARLMMFLRLVCHIAPEQRPRGAGECQAFTQLSGRIIGLFRRCTDPRVPVADLERKVINASARWMVELQREEFMRAERRLREDALAGIRLTNCADFLRAALLGCGDEQNAQDAFWARVASVSLRRLVQCSESWHGMPPVDLEEEESHDEGPEWPPVLRKPFEWNRIRIEELINRVMLQQEGRQMNHCVAGYGDACRSGDSAVFSLRCKQSGAASTLEITLDETSARAHVVQHKAERNGIPAQQLVRAASELLATLNDSTNLPAMFARVRFQLNERAHAFRAGPYSAGERQAHILAWAQLRE